MPLPPGSIDLSSYVDTRFKIVADAITEKLLARDQALAAALIQITDKLSTAVTALRETATASDLRYQERFVAQQEAMVSLLTAQKTATELAMSVSERALAAAEKGVQRMADAVDARVVEQGKHAEDRERSLSSRIKEQETRMDAVEARVNLSSGETQGGVNRGTAQRNGIAIGVSVLALLSSVTLGLLNLLLR
jgi:hypothetical protein